MRDDRAPLEGECLAIPGGADDGGGALPAGRGSAFHIRASVAALNDWPSGERASLASAAAAAGMRTATTSASARSTPSAMTVHFRVLDVEREAFLGAVGPDEMRGQSLDGPVVAACGVPDARALNLDHARTQLGELAGAEGAGDHLLEGDHREIGRA